MSFILINIHIHVHVQAHVHVEFVIYALSLECEAVRKDGTNDEGGLAQTVTLEYLIPSYFILE